MNNPPMDNPPTTATTSWVPEASDDRMDYRLEFWRGVADMFGVSDSAVDEALVELDPLTIFDRLLPGRSAEECSEVMWALGEFERQSNAAARRTRRAVAAPASAIQQHDAGACSARLRVRLAWQARRSGFPGHRARRERRVVADVGSSLLRVAVCSVHTARLPTCRSGRDPGCCSHCVRSSHDRRGIRDRAASDFADGHRAAPPAPCRVRHRRLLVRTRNLPRCVDLQFLRSGRDGARLLRRLLWCHGSGIVEAGRRSVAGHSDPRPRGGDWLHHR